MKYLIPLIFVFSITQSFSQTFQITDQYVFGGNSYDSPIDGVNIIDNTVLCGNSISDNTGDKTSANYGAMDIWVVSLDANNLIEWQNSFGGNSDDQVVKMTETLDGNFLIASWSNSGANGNKTAPNKGGSDFWIIKIDDSGNEIWQQTYGGSGDDYFADFKELPDGTILLVGASDSPISGDKTEDSFGALDYWLVKIDQNGNVLWDKTIGGSGNDGASSIYIDENENVYLSGASESPVSGYKTESNFNGSSDIWVVKLDNSGNVLWDKTLGGDQNEMSSTLFCSNDRVYAMGNSLSGVSGTKTESSRGSWDYWTTKLDNEGNVLMDKTYGGDGLDQLINSKLVSTGEFILAGSSDSGVSGEVENPTHNNSMDFWVLVVDSSDLSLKSQFMFGGDQSEVLPNILELENNSLLLFGGSDSGVSGDKTEPSKGGTDFWMLEMSTDLGVSTQDKEELLSIYPNPTTNVFNVSNLSTEENYSLTIYDNMGRKVLQSKISATNNRVEVNSLSSGMYNVQLFDGKRRYVSKLIVE